jgi:hypothetical protein
MGYMFREDDMDLDQYGRRCSYGYPVIETEDLMEEDPEELTTFDLPWSINPFTRCRAFLEPNETVYFGRCELKRGHKMDHALERGFDILRFETKIIGATTKY